MAKQIYRKSLLERLSSPDQLDKMIVITPPSFWLALLGGAVIVVVALVWSIFGRLPIKLDANGIFVSDQKAFTLASDTACIVDTLETKVGDYVQEGDVLFTLADESMQRELDALLDRRAKVEAVTLTSINDVVTADNRELINLKTQLGGVSVESEQNQAMLAVYQAELTSLRPKVAAAKTQMESSREKYYSYIAATADSNIEIAFSEAQTAYSQNMPALNSALSSAEWELLEAKSAYQQLAQSIKAYAVSRIDAELNNAEEEYNSAVAAWESVEEAKRSECPYGRSDFLMLARGFKIQKHPVQI